MARNTPDKKDSLAEVLIIWWAGVDSNHRSLATADLQSAPFSHSGTYPLSLYLVVNSLFCLLCRSSDWRTFTRLSLVKRYLIFFLRALCLRVYSGTYPLSLYLVVNSLFCLLCRSSDWRTFTRLSLVKRYLIFFLRALCLRVYSGTYPLSLYLFVNPLGIKFALDEI